MRVAGLLAAILLLPSAGAAMPAVQHGAPEAPTDAVLLAQLAVQLAPQVVERAIAEARLHGSVVQARAAAADLFAATARAAEQPVPAGSSYPELAAASVQFAHDVAQALVALPDDLAALERARGNCGSWVSNATAVQLVGWAVAARPAIVRLHGLAALLDALASRAPEGVDGAPFTRALGLLRDELVPREERCLPALDVIAVTILPPRAWPTAFVTVVVAGTRDGPAQLDSDLFRADVEIRDGAAVHRAQVPRDATLGPHTIHASMGNLTSNATLEVVRAPARLRIDGDLRGLVGATLTLRATVVTPLPGDVGPGPLRVDGDRRAEIPLEGIHATFTFAAPSTPGVVQLRFAYPGSRLVERAEANVSVAVVAPVAAATDVEPPVADRVDLLDRAWIAVGLLAATAGSVTLWAIHRRRLARAHAPVPASGTPAAPAGPAALEARGLLDTVASLVRALRRAGAAAPSDTVRETAARLGQPEVTALVEPFERARYGGEAVEVEAPLLDRAIARVRAWLGVPA